MAVSIRADRIELVSVCVGVASKLKVSGLTGGDVGWRCDWWD